MTKQLNGGAAVAAALAHLLAGYPELESVAWSVGETPGVLVGQHTALSGRGESIDRCAEVMGGTVARTEYRRTSHLFSADSHGEGCAQLVTTYRGVQVRVSGTYPLPGPDGFTSTDLAAAMAARPLGTVAVLPAVGR